jgi:tRNA threonylcarbamoyladenosine biosynthesis protein TsaB
MILGVDSSLALLSVALVESGRTVAAIALEGRESRNEKLLPAIDWLLSEAGVQKGSISLFAVTRGPGSFTGVRIGLATVQGLARALGRPLCAMSTHEALARLDPAARCVVWGDAGRGELYASAWDSMALVVAPSVVTQEKLAELRREFERPIEIEHELNIANVAALAALRAEELERRGDLDRYADATPIYVRLAEAEARLLKKHG